MSISSAQKIDSYTMSISQFPPPASPSPASSSRSLTSTSPYPASLSSSMRLWKPAAQRNLRNQWSKLSTCRQQWIAASFARRSHATSLVNAYLSQKYMPMIELGVLSDMFDIKKKALKKLFEQQSSYRINLLSSYKEMVAVVVEIVNASRSLRCYMKLSSGSLIQFSASKEDLNDAGDCGGMLCLVFGMPLHLMAEELVEMFKREVMLKSTSVGQLSFTKGNLMISANVSEPILPPVKEDDLGISISHTNQPTAEILQIHLTTWIAGVNIHTRRVDEILALVGEEIRVTF